MIRAYSLSLLGILLFAFFPILLVAIAGGIASLGDCRLNEATVNPCVIAGVDLGGILYSMWVLGWLMIATLPIGALLLACWFLALLVQLLVIRRRRKAGS